MVIDKNLLDIVSEQAKASPRLRMNYNFHQSLDEKCHRFLNAVEPGTEVPIHKLPTKDETFVIMRGKVRVTTHRDDGTVIEDVVLCAEDGRYGVNIPKVTGDRYLSPVGHPFPAVCIRTSTERPEALDKACFFIAGIDEKSLLQAVDTAVTMNQNGDYGIPVLDYVEENVSTKVVKIIQSYVGIVNKMVWRKS